MTAPARGLNILPGHSSKSPPPSLGTRPGAAARARSLATVLGADANLVEAAAWLLHDIDYAPNLVVTGLHALDGARYLRDARYADTMLCRPVRSPSR